MAQSTLEVGKKLVELCQQGKNMEAVESLYADDVVSVEASPNPGEGPESAVTNGKDGVRKKGEWWYANHEMHSGEVLGPFPHGDRFAVIFKFEVTPKSTGKRMAMEEVALYSVEAGKIVKEEFFYDMV